MSKELKESLLRFNGLENNIENLIGIFMRTMTIALDRGIKGSDNFKINGWLQFLDKEYIIFDTTSDIIQVYLSNAYKHWKSFVFISKELENKVNFVCGTFCDDEPSANDFIPMIKYFWRVKSLHEIDDMLTRNSNKVFGEMDKFKQFAHNCLSMRNSRDDIDKQIMDRAMKF